MNVTDSNALADRRRRAGERDDALGRKGQGTPRNVTSAKPPEAWVAGWIARVVPRRTVFCAGQALETMDPCIALRTVAIVSRSGLGGSEARRKMTVAQKPSRGASGETDRVLRCWRA